MRERRRGSDHRLGVVGLLLAAGLGCATGQHGPGACGAEAASAVAAARFVAELSRRSPSHDGIPLRRYEIRDLDHDGRFEVLEHRSHFEDAVGWLNVELEPAFVWVGVHRLGPAGFEEDMGSFPWFLRLREQHYEHWLRLLREPSAAAALLPGSQKLVAANPHLVEALQELLARTRSLIRAQ